MKFLNKRILLLLLLALPCLGFASQANTLVNLPVPSQLMAPSHVAPALKMVALLTLLSVAPAILIMLTSFTRIVIVLSMLRHALGLQQTPPNMVIMSLSLFLTLFTMMPVADQIYKHAYQPYQKHQINLTQAIKTAEQPVKKFMVAQTREKDMALIYKLSHSKMPDTAKAVPMYKLIPAFMLSELQTAFEIGFIIFIPFILIDLLVSGILMTMGMVMVPPMTISLPLKIMVFVLISGWDLVINSLVGSFHLV